MVLTSVLPSSNLNIGRKRTTCSDTWTSSWLPTAGQNHRTGLWPTSAGPVLDAAALVLLLAAMLRLARQLRAVSTVILANLSFLFDGCRCDRQPWCLDDGVALLAIPDALNRALDVGCCGNVHRRAARLWPNAGPHDGRRNPVELHNTTPR
jgi:hypothetical protein